jgi:hypothetical protein
MVINGEVDCTWLCFDLRGIGTEAAKYGVWVHLTRIKDDCVARLLGLLTRARHERSQTCQGKRLFPTTRDVNQTPFDLGQSFEAATIAK